MTLLEVGELVRTRLIDAETCPEWAHEGQRKVWESLAQTILVCAGNQGGKTALNAYWLLRQIQRRAETIKRMGFGNFIYAGPTMTLLEAQAMPQLERLFTEEHNLGRLVRSGKPKYHFSEDGARRLLGFAAPVTVHFAYANDPNNLESLTALDGVWDEMGQSDNKEASYEAYLRRLGIARSMGLGQMLCTTTPYEWGWFKRRVVDPAMAGEEGFSYHNWPTWMNPLQDEETCRRILDQGMDSWKWEMMYEGKWTRPEGAVYPNFDSRLETDEYETNVVAKVKVESDWKWYVGADFGPRNTALSLIVHDPEKDVFYKVREYHAGADEVDKHVRALYDLMGKGSQLTAAYGGAASEDDWRKKFKKAGLYIKEPKFKGAGAVEARIQSVYELIQQKKYKVLASCKRTIAQYEDYSYDKDTDGRITERIKDKEFYHLLDADGYLLSTLRPGTALHLKDYGSRFSKTWQ